MRAIPWPIDDGVYDKVLAFQLVEHLPITETIPFFQECRRVLATGGLLILECPDMKGLAQEYLKGNEAMLYFLFSGDRFPGDEHRWGHTKESLSTLAYAVGFTHCVTKPGTDYHSVQMPTIRLEAVR